MRPVNVKHTVKIDGRKVLIHAYQTKRESCTITVEISIKKWYGYKSNFVERVSVAWIPNIESEDFLLCVVEIAMQKYLKQTEKENMRKKQIEALKNYSCNGGADCQTEEI